VSGLAWTLLQPLAQLAVFAIVFTQIFRAGVPPEFKGVGYTAFVAVALWPWIMFSEALQRGMVAISGNGGLIRKVALPNQVFVYAAVLACYGLHLLGFAGVLAVLAASGEPILAAGVPAAVVLLFPYLLFTMGLALFLAALQTLLKDVEHGVAVVLQLVFYATPILYPLAFVPESWRAAMRSNPLAHFSGRLRDVLLADPHLIPSDLWLLAVGVAAFLAGRWVFGRVSPYFEDFL
jgi:ABC-type polysaccharide/polyol phosphate export permease